MLGYCLCPLNIAAILVKFLLYSLPIFIPFIVSLLGFLWATYCSFYSD